MAYRAILAQCTYYTPEQYRIEGTRKFLWWMPNAMILYAWRDSSLLYKPIICSHCIVITILFCFCMLVYRRPSRLPRQYFLVVWYAFQIMTATWSNGKRSCTPPVSDCVQLFRPSLIIRTSSRCAGSGCVWESVAALSFTERSVGKIKFYHSSARLFRSYSNFHNTAFVTRIESVQSEKT